MQSEACYILWVRLSIQAKDHGSQVERAHDKRTPTLGEQQSCLCQVSGIKIKRIGSFEKLLINNASTFALSQHVFCTIFFARKDWILFRYLSSSVI